MALLRKASLVSLVLLALSAGARAESRAPATPFAAPKAKPVAPMTFTLARTGPPECGSACGEVIVASGEIQPASSADFIAFWAQAGQRNLPVLLNSPGGNLEGGMRLGRAFRRLSVATSVGVIPSEAGPLTPAACNSACVYAFAGGVRRTLLPGSTLGIHQFYMARAGDAARQPKERYSSAEFGAMQRSVSGLATYLAEMGASLDVLTLAAEVRPAEIRALSAGEALALGLTTSADSGPAFAPTPERPQDHARRPLSPQTVAAAPAAGTWPVVVREGRPWLVLTAPSTSRRFGEIANEVAIGCPPDGKGFVAAFQEKVPQGGLPGGSATAVIAPNGRAERLAATGSQGQLRGAISRETTRSAESAGVLEVEVTSPATAGYPMRIAFPGAGLGSAMDRLEKACRDR